MTLLPARTFWEEVTALHAESFRNEVPHFFSRHYSDVAEIFQTNLVEARLATWRCSRLGLRFSLKT